MGLHKSTLNSGEMVHVAPSRFSIVATSTTTSSAASSDATTTGSSIGKSNRSHDHISKSFNTRGGRDYKSHDSYSDYHGDERRTSSVEHHRHAELINQHGSSSSSTFGSSDQKALDPDKKANKPNPSSSMLAFKPRGLVTKPKSKIQL